MIHFAYIPYIFEVWPNINSRILQGVEKKSDKKCLLLLMNSAKPNVKHALWSYVTKSID